jgi:alkylation response protein AidB-like acyl-CoA dehydrogenase
VQFLIADMAIGVYTSRAMVYDAVRAFTEQNTNASRLAAIAKTYASDVAMSVSSAGVTSSGRGAFGSERDLAVWTRDRIASTDGSTFIFRGTFTTDRIMLRRRSIDGRPDDG